MVEQLVEQCTCIQLDSSVKPAEQLKSLFPVAVQLGLVTDFSRQFLHLRRLLSLLRLLLNVLHS